MLLTPLVLAIAFPLRALLLAGLMAVMLLARAEASSRVAVRVTNIIGLMPVFWPGSSKGHVMAIHLIGGSPTDFARVWSREGSTTRT